MTIGPSKRQTLLRLLYKDEIAEKLEEIINRLQNMVKDVAIFEFDKVVDAA